MKKIFFFSRSFISATVAVGISVMLFALQSVGGTPTPLKGNSYSMLGGTSTAAAMAQSNQMASEARALQSFANALTTFENQSKKLAQRNKITDQRTKNAEAQSLRSAGAALKSTLLSTRDALGSIISKIKTQGKWTSDLDVLVEDHIRKSTNIDKQTQDKLIALLIENGGARAAMENALLHLTSPSLKDEIDNDVKRLNPSVVGSQFDLASQARLVAFNFTPPSTAALVKPVNWKCAAGVGVFAAGIGAAVFCGCLPCAFGGAAVAFGACP